MRSRQRSILFSLIFTFAGFIPVFAQDLHPWNGYVQSRFTGNNEDVRSFSVRRAKLWYWNTLPNHQKWDLKVQGIFLPQKSGGFTLQDAFIEYSFANGHFRFGQMVPEFSLQRSQPDFRLPVLERGAIIDALIPAAESGARDIGFQTTFQDKNKKWHISAGMFNGNGGNQIGNEDKSFLFTSRTYFAANPTTSVTLHLGASLAYRKTNGLSFKKIFGDNRSFTGSDLRYGLEFLLHTSKWQFQAEYIEVKLEKNIVHGIFATFSHNLSAKNQLVFSSEIFNDLNPATVNHPWYIAGWNYLISGNRAKLMTNIRFQKTNSQINTQAVIQLQLFIH